MVAWWLQKLAEEGGPITAWLALDSDASLHLVLQHLTEALRANFPAIDDLRTRHAAGALSLRQFVHPILDEIDRSGRHVVVVLDDLHTVSDPHILDLLQEILGRRMPHLHLVLLSRTRPALQFSRLILEDAALMVDEHQLRFDHHEFNEFVRSSSLAALNAEQLALVEERCDGWVAALQLMALALPHASIHVLLGNRTDNLLLEHLEYEVFRRLPLDLQRFLIEVSPLPFLTTELIATVTRRTALEAERLLKRALEFKVFLTTPSMQYGGETSRTRFHPLFRELLLQKLLSDADAGAVGDLHNRAADWLADHGEVDAALSLLLPHYPDAAAALVARNLRHALQRSNFVAARSWLNRLPAAIRTTHPELTINAAWLAFLTNDRNLSMHVNAARAAIIAHDDPQIHAEIDVLHALGLYLKGERQAAAAAAAQLCTGSGLAAGYRCMLEALLHDQPTQLDIRRRAVHQAGEIFRTINFPAAAIDAALGICVLERREGRSLDALAAYENAHAIIRHFGHQHSAIAVDAHVQFGEHLYLMDRIDEARAQFSAAVAIADRYVPRCVDGYQAHVGLHLCDLAAGITPVINDADDSQLWAATFADHSPLLVLSCAWSRLVRDMRIGRLDRVRATVAAFGVHVDALTEDMHEFLRLLVLAGAALTENTSPQLTTTLASFTAEMHRAHNPVVTARARALFTLHLHSMRDEAGTRKQKFMLESDVSKLLMPRLLTDFSPLMVMETHAPSPDGHNTDLLGISRQERRVLTLLAQDLSNKEIAAQLSLSVATVSTHLQSVFRKLNVHSREAAIRAARAAGL